MNRRPRARPASGAAQQRLALLTEFLRASALRDGSADQDGVTGATGSDLDSGPDSDLDSDLDHEAALDFDHQRDERTPVEPVVVSRGQAVAPEGETRTTRHWADLTDVFDRLGLRRSPAVRRPSMSGQHALVVAVVVVLFLTLSAWWYVSSRPSEVTPVELSAPQVESTTTDADGDPAAEAGATQAPATSDDPVASDGPNQPSAAGSQVVVDVTGKVRRPGIVTLPTGARVYEALASAGGARKGVDTDTLNLARLLVDGEQIVVGMPPVDPLPPAGTAPPSGTAPPADPGTPTGPVALVNLNTATMEQLDTLPGVGPVTAQAILDWRTEHGSFSSVDELIEVSGIGDVTLAELRDLVTV